MDLYQHPKVKITKLFSFPGASLQISAQNGPDLMFCKLKAFKLKEDITLFTNKEMQEPLLNIKARQILDFSAAYDVYDSKSKEKIGAFKRHGWKSSLLKDHWSIMNQHDTVLGDITEDHVALALLRRVILGSILPQNYNVSISGDNISSMSRMPIINILNLDFSNDANRRLDRRLGIAAGVLLCVIEGMQN
ncbi:MAG: hypothetical protein K2X27_02265 [Candidatus Obscuribacterales bacterium]|nr:hypothetical protein [Candidatus Obscuribacterales bacterium]